MESPVFFRMGFFDQMKFNLLNYSKVLYEDETWYKVDLLLDWDASDTAIFVNGEYINKAKFFSAERDNEKLCDKTFVNTLMLYSLSPGVESSFKDIRLCSELCPGTQQSDFPLTKGSKELEDPFAVLSGASAVV